MKTAYVTIMIALIGAYVNSPEANAQGTWSQKAKFPGSERTYSTGFSIGTKGYMGIGLDDATGSPTKDFWEYDQATDTWTQKADFLAGIRYQAVGFSIGTKGYIGTGDDDVNFQQDFWEWDQLTNTWSQKTNFGGTARWSATGFSIGTKGYIGTGRTTSGTRKDFWEWDGDPASLSYNTWTQKADFGGVSRYYAVGFSIGSKGYIGTGFNSSGDHKDFWEYNPATNAWIQKADFGGVARDDAAAFSIGAKGYIGLGWDDNSDYLNDFWEWDQATDTWTKKTDFGGTARQASAGFSIGNKGYIGTGEDLNAILNDFWEYDPAGITSVSENNEIIALIFPNPFYTQATLRLSKEVNNGALIIYDLSGKEIKRLVIPNGVKNLSIEREDFPTGTYFYQVVEEQKISNGKLIIQ